MKFRHSKLLSVLREYLEPVERSLFHERVRLFEIAIQYNWRVTMAKSTGTVAQCIIVHNRHLVKPFSDQKNKNAKNKNKTMGSPSIDFLIQFPGEERTSQSVSGAVGPEPHTQRYVSSKNLLTLYIYGKKTFSVHH